MVTNENELIQTANGYLLCPAHAEAWQRGGNDVSMWPANDWEVEDGGGECADCADEAALDCEAPEFREGDKVMGLGRHGAIWRRKPIGTVTLVHRIMGEQQVRVQWDKSVVEDDMAPADLIPMAWSEQLGRYVTTP